MKTYYITYKIHGSISVAVQAESEKDAVEKGYEEFTPEDVGEIEWEFGYPCHTGWPEYFIDDVEDEGDG